MKKFLPLLFWRRNPKAGAAFGLLLAVIALTLTLPIASFLRVVLGWLLVPGRVADILFAVSCVALPYALFLQLRFAWDVLRAKGKNTRARLAMFVALVFAAACGILYAFDTQIYALFSSCFFAAILALSVAIDSVPSEKRVGKWMWIAPLTVFIMLPLQDLIILPVLSANAEKKATAVAQAHGVTWTQLVHNHTNGVDAATNPFQLLFTREGNLPSLYELRRIKLAFEPITDEELERFDAYLSTNATLLALLDQMTDAPIQKPATSLAKTTDMLLGQSQIAPSSWTCLYCLKIIFAAHRQDAETATDAVHRLQHISDYARQRPLLIGRLSWANTEGWRFEALACALPLLPDATLATLQNELLQPSENIADLKRILCEELVYCQKTYSEIRLPASYPESLRAHPKFWRYMLPFACVKLQHFVLHCAQKMPEPLAALEAPAPSDFQRLATLNAMSRKNAVRSLMMTLDVMSNLDIYQMTLIMLPGLYKSHLSLLERRNAAAIAIAVERFRRAHGAFPETLDALVPDFIGRVPESIFNEGAFDYVHGDVATSLNDWDKKPIVRGFQISSIDPTRAPARKRFGARFIVPIQDE